MAVWCLSVALLLISFLPAATVAHSASHDRDTIAALQANDTLFALPASSRAVTGLRECLSANAFLPGAVIARDDPAFLPTRAQALIQDPVANPALFVRPENTDQVQKAVRCALDNGVTFCARSGGHSWSSSSTCPGMVLDLQNMTALALNSARTYVTFGAGITIGQAFYQVYNKTQKALPVGSCPSVGVGGFIQGGGVGPLSGVVGLMSDLVTEMTVITPNGERRTVTATQNKPLFWALRGGGAGYLGIVTDFKVRLVPPSAGYNQNVYFGYTWPQETAASAFHEWTSYAQVNDGYTYIRMSAPRLNGARFARVMGVCWRTSDMATCRQRLARTSLWTVPGRNESFMYSSTQGVLEAQKFFTRAGRFGKMKPPSSLESSRDVFSDRFVTKGSLETKSWSSIMWDDSGPIKPTADFFQGLFDLADSQVENGSAGSITFAFYPFGKAVRSKPSTFSAFPHRDRIATLAVFYSGGLTKTSRLRSKDNIQRFLAMYRGGTYLNYHDINLNNYAEEYWRSNLGRMRMIKRRLDPADMLWTVQPL